MQVEGEDLITRVVKRVSKVSLESLLDLMNSCDVPTTFDLFGQKICRTSVSTNEYIVTTNNVKIQNGTIWMHDEQQQQGASLCVKGKNFEMENMTVKGGQIGVCVWPGGKAVLRNCRFTGMMTCMITSSHPSTAAYAVTLTAAAVPARLEAYHVRMTGCGCGVHVHANTKMQLTDCDVICTERTSENAIHVEGTLQALRLNSICANARGAAVKVGRVGCVEMTDSILTSVEGGGGIVQTPGGKFTPADCVVNGVGVAESGLSSSKASSRKNIKVCGYVCRKCPHHQPQVETKIICTLCPFFGIKIMRDHPASTPCQQRIRIYFNN